MLYWASLTSFVSDHDILVADGPYTDIEHVVKEATNNFLASDPTLEHELKTSVIGRMKSNPSFRRNTPHASSFVRERVVKIEVCLMRTISMRI